MVEDWGGGVEGGGDELPEPDEDVPGLPPLLLPLPPLLLEPCEELPEVSEPSEPLPVELVSETESLL